MARGPNGVSVALLSIQSAWCGVLGLNIYQFWKRRKQLSIFARWPALAFLSGLAGIVVQTSIVVQEVMAQEGEVFPCIVILHLHPVLVGLYAMPYILRGVRAVVISDTVWKKKYMAFLSRKTVFTFLGVFFLALQGVCIMLGRAAPNVYGENPTELCVYLVDWWFWGSTCIVVVLAVSRIFVELSRLKDRISMAKEILTTVGVWLTFAAPYFGILVLHTYARVDMPRQIGFLLWLSVFFTLGSTFIIEPRRRQGKVYLCRMKSTKVAIIVDDATTAAWREKWNSSEAMMSHPIFDEAFENHVREYLCSESYDFIKEVEKYVAHAEQAPVQSVFEQFRRIVDTYILAGSELAINIQTTMQNKILEIGSKSSFVEAEMETRRDVFNASKAEIFKLLDDNLIQSFWASTLFLDSCKRWQEALDAASLDGARLQDKGDILRTSRNTRLLSISTLTSLLKPSTYVEN